MTRPFAGTKIALYYENQLIVYLRDNKPEIPYANMWDFPGGGREGEESALECAVREIEEEFAITLKSEAFVWERTYPAQLDPSKEAYFFVARIDKHLFDSIQFGEEGQEWRLMSPKEFLAREDAIPRLKEHLQDYLDDTSK